MRRITVVLALGMLLAACSGENAAESGDMLAVDQGATATTVADAAEAPTEGDGGGIAVALEGADGRKVIRNAELQLEADDTRAAFDRIVAMAEAAGGFIADATVHPVEGEEDQPSVTMTLRVPATGLTRLMIDIKESVNTVVSESQGSQDVTEQYVDLEARLTNLEALEVELRALLADVRQQPEADPEKLLRVYNEIASVRGQIEQIQGQLNYLDDVVELATLQVGLTPTPTVVPIVEDTWQPVEAARDALRNLVVGFQGVADAVIQFVLYVLPMFLLTLGLPLLVGIVVYRQWRKRRPPATPSAPATTEA